ncbi:hypothetical protein [Enhygromyxa salina]|uniref:hypothetical protein n=1 Tax=Enhygromyxa salina TaxID=215803 RepID=UPI0004E71C2D|nr:hypothetical protein [Enhygromyxa salina]
MAGPPRRLRRSPPGGPCPVRATRATAPHQRPNGKAAWELQSRARGSDLTATGDDAGGRVAEQRASVRARAEQARANCGAPAQILPTVRRKLVFNRR